MKIFKVERLDTWDYDDYSDFVCFANSEQEARYIHPCNDDDDYFKWDEELGWIYSYRKEKVKVRRHGWVDNPKELKVTELITNNAFKPEIICASYHAG